MQEHLWQQDVGLAKQASAMLSSSDFYLLLL